MSNPNTSGKVLKPDWGDPAQARDLPEAARLIYDANWKFYDLFSESKEAILDNVQRQMRETGTEVSNGRVLLQDGRLLGIHCYYGSEEIEGRQLASLRMLMDVAQPRSDAMVRLRAFRKEVEPIAERSLYLSRIAVAPESRGKGIGQIMLRDFEQIARQAGYSMASLHVMNGNQPAIRFYTTAGYVLRSAPDRGFLSLVKHLPDR